MEIISRSIFEVGNHKQFLINKILRIIFNPMGKFFTVAYKVPCFEMIRLNLNIEDSLHFSFFVFAWNITHTKHPNSNHISSRVGIKDGLRFDYGSSTDFYV